MPKNHRSMRRRPMFAPLFLPIAGFMVAALAVAWFLDSQATTTVIIVRHAEPAGALENDPGLSERGRQRAALLARTLEDVDVVRGLDAIYTVPLTAARETAEPLARRLDLEIHEGDDSELEPLMEGLVRRYKGKIVLMVARGEQLPLMTAALGGHKSTPEVAGDEYSNIYLLAIPWFGRTKTLRVHYGLGAFEDLTALEHTP